jgi:two-component system sensor histidine kinase KdpD
LNTIPPFWFFISSVPWADPVAALLTAGERRKRAGWDVVLAGSLGELKPQLAQVAANFEQVALQQHAGGFELDVDALLIRRPRLVLLTDLVAQQSVGARHPQRYMVAQELLAAGIGVYTNLFVGQLASRVDAVQKILQIPTDAPLLLPDALLDQATHIELVDPDPLDLPEGYNVLQHAALRVLTLRCISEQLDHRLQSEQQLKYILGTGQATERLMTAVSASPFSERLLRWTRRLAFNLEAKWYAVNIQPTQLLPPAAQKQLDHNLDLARQLGAEVLVVPGDDAVTNLLRVAQQRNVQHLVVGKTVQPCWRDWLQGRSLADRLIAASGDLDVFVVSAKPQENTPELWQRPNAVWQRADWLRMSLALLSLGVLIALAVMWPMLITHEVLGLLLLLFLAGWSTYLYWLPLVLLSVLVVTAWGTLGLFTLAGQPNLWRFLVSSGIYSGLAFALSWLVFDRTEKQRYQDLRESRLVALSKLSRRMAAAADLNAVLLVAREQIYAVFGAPIAVFLVQPNGQFDPTPHPVSNWAAPEPASQNTILLWVQTRQRPAGLFTGNFPSAPARYHPLLASGSFGGVLAVALHPKQPFSAEQRTLLQEFTDRIAYAIQRELLLAAKQQAELLQQSEKLFTTLLDSVSHELRTPLATISSTADLLLSTRQQLQPAARQTLGSDLNHSVARLNRVVDNLLDISRLESGRLELRLEWCDLRELLAVTRRQLQAQLSQHTVELQLPDDFIWVRLDFKLFNEVLYNLLLNACTYTPPGSLIEVSIKQSEQGTDLLICDNGPGLPDSQAVFQKFYRGKGSKTSGMGLGLTICRGYVEVHRGQLTAYNRSSGGACFLVHLPYERPPSLPEG